MEEDHYQLLDVMTKAISVEGLGFSPELMSNLSRLHERLFSTPQPYKAVVDGLNVSHRMSNAFSVMQVSMGRGERVMVVVEGEDGGVEVCASLYYAVGSGCREPVGGSDGWSSAGRGEEALGLCNG